MKTDLKIENRGFTLIEMIVVVAIVALVIGLTFTLTPLFVQSARSSADQLQGALLDTRTATYAKDKGDSVKYDGKVVSGVTATSTPVPTCLQITRRNKAIYVQMYVNGTLAGDEEKLGRYTGNMSYGLDGSASVSYLSDTDPVYVAFDKNTGEVTYLGTMSSNLVTGSLSDAVFTFEAAGSKFVVTTDGLTGRTTTGRS